MAGVFCLAAPLAVTLLSALPARMMQRSAAQVGAVIRLARHPPAGPHQCYPGHGA